MKLYKVIFGKPTDSAWVLDSLDCYFVLAGSYEEAESKAVYHAMKSPGKSVIGADGSLNQSASIEYSTFVKQIVIISEHVIQ